MGKQQRKQVLIEAADALFRERFIAVAQTSCLYRAWCLVSVAESRGVQMLIQAGSAWWRITPEGQEKPEGPAPFFGYQWQGIEKARELLQQNIMPEMHVWAVVPHRGEVVDVTAGVQRQQAAALGLEWRTPELPPYLWDTGSKLAKKHGALYMADEEATRIAFGLVEREATRLGLKKPSNTRRLVRARR